MLRIIVTALVGTATVAATSIALSPAATKTNRLPLMSVTSTIENVSFQARWDAFEEAKDKLSEAKPVDRLAQGAE
jgi:hypothetical protein